MIMTRDDLGDEITTVDGYDGAGDERGRGRTEKYHRAGNVARFAPAGERRTCKDRAAPVWIVLQGVRQLRGDPAGSNGIDPDPIGGIGNRERFRELCNAAFARAVTGHE